ncbi:MAG: molybdenum cofactor biosynthesis protein MoaE [Halomonas sp.]|nr:molybdenum cofactor biosynthesis protein MoaE [Halomonas sp.]MDN6297378.1 molybdenum cofactor biosynthesis protein MoaE [Halomonas sp.]MDN6314093.1 molybdenum cofactor biosynthesis protein MoaE [Halomonas sp.]MDN6335363.1 molybdenum cofactor biosynthesis protein MoaE [Halomonas sp.]
MDVHKDIRVSVQHEPFSSADDGSELGRGRTDIGAVVCFTGLVRDFNESPDVTGLTLEHYPGMTERTLEDIGREAWQRWSLKAVRIVHRVGYMAPGDGIVRVSAASTHRRDAFEACDFIMDFLKTRAPFWKKEHAGSGDYWVKERATDYADADRWES